MTDIRPTPQGLNFKQRFTQAAQDKQITQKETQALKAHIEQMNIPVEDKQGLNKMVDQLKKATNGQFLFFKWRSGINTQEKAGLEALAKENRMAGQLLMFYNEATTQKPVLDTRLTQSSQNTNYNPSTQARSRHSSNPNGVQFPQSNSTGATQSTQSSQAVDNSPMGNMEAELFEAIMNYPGNKATEAEAKQIAKTLNEAAQAMGFSADNTRKMLAVFAHESGGFDPDAKSHTGAGGLGQLTGVAIEDMNRLAQNGKYSQFRSNFIRPGGDRTDITKNIWTSVAYMDHLMGEIGSQDVGNAFVAYNTGVGGYRALMTMGDGADAYLERATGVRGKGNEARSYAGLVQKAYNRMFS